MAPPSRFLALLLVLLAALAVVAPAVAGGALPSPDVLSKLLSAKTDPSEVAALRAIYGNISNAGYALADWNFNHDPCEPLGPFAIAVMCTLAPSGSYTITDLNFFLPITGTFSPEVSRLTSLTHLLIDHALVEPEPLLHSVTALTQLQELTLTMSQAPARVLSLASLSNLRLLSLHSMGLTGDISALQLSSLTRLTVLDVGNNRLTGSIPETMGSPQDLTLLYLSYNSLSGAIPGALFTNQPGLSNIDLSYNRLSGSIPQELGSLPSLLTLDFSNNSLSGAIPNTLALSPTLYSIRINNNQLSGSIPPLFEACQSFSYPGYLMLANNSLSGAIPDSIALYAFRLPRIFSLDVTNNHLSGPVSSLFASAGAALYLANNTALCGHSGLPSCPPSPPASPVRPFTPPSTPYQPASSSSSSSLSSGAVAGIATAAAVAGLALALLGFVGYQRWVRRGSDHVADEEALSLSEKKLAALEAGYHRTSGTKDTTYSFGGAAKKVQKSTKARPRLEGSVLFSLDELLEATHNFHPSTLLGRGGFGHVYRGTLPGTGEEVAIKVLNRSDLGGPLQLDGPTASRPEGGSGEGGSGRTAQLAQGEKEYEAEVQLLTTVRHRHLVRLVGFCCDHGERMLVYEFMPGGSLAQHLHGSSGPRLSWAVRMRIAVGVARGLAYLHEGCAPRIVHRDVKPSNVLLDAELTPKLSDFGLARVVPDGTQFVDTMVQGTLGYVAPEYAAREGAGMSEKVDVYSFGVLLLELVSGRSPLGDGSLLTWAGTLVSQQQLPSLVDPLLFGDFNKEELRGVVTTMLACVQREAAQRPAMSQVLLQLEKATAGGQ